MENVEKRVPHKRNVTKDFGGFADLIAYNRDGDTIGIQATTTDNVTHRMDKILHLTEEKGGQKIWAWIFGGRRIIVQGWAIRGRGEEKEWTTKTFELQVDNKLGIGWHEVGT